MSSYINTRIRNKYDTIANWNNSTEVLLKGEMAFAIMTDGNVRLKVGDGEHVFKDLSFAAQNSTVIRNWTAL